MSNPVIKFLELHQETTFSTKTIAKRLNINRPKVNYYKKLEFEKAKSEKRDIRFTFPKPISVGSNKYKNNINLIKYNQVKST